MRRTCDGSERKPDGVAALLSSHRNPRGICQVCGDIFPVRKDGTLIVHRSTQ